MTNFEVPSDIRDRAKSESESGAEIRVTPIELIEMMDKADRSLNSDQTYSRYDALLAIREALSEIFEDPDRRF